MSKQIFKVDIDLEKNELLRARIQNESTANIPLSPVVGQVYYDTDFNKMGIFTGVGGWLYFVAGSGSGSGYISDILASQPAINVSISGTVATITIDNATASQDGFMPKEDKSKLDAATSSNTSGTLVERDSSGIISVSQITITNTPTNPTDAATKGYVDGLVQGLKTKLPARVISQTNITLNGVQTIDGVTVAENDRVLVVGQTDAKDNGIYIVKTAAWTRALDLTTGDSAANTYLFVGEGTTEADTGWVCTSDIGSDVVGTNNITFVKFSSAGVIEAGTGLTKTGNIINAIAGDNTMTIGANDMRVRINAAGAITATTDGIGVNTDGAYIKLVGNQVTIGDRVSTTVFELVTLFGGTPSTITHNLNTLNVHTTIISQSTGEHYVLNVKNASSTTVVVESNSDESVRVIISGAIGISV